MMGYWHRQTRRFLLQSCCVSQREIQITLCIFTEFLIFPWFCFCKAKDAIDENSPSEKAVNGPATTSGDEPSKLQHSPDEKKVTVQEDGNNQEEAVLNGVS